MQSRVGAVQFRSNHGDQTTKGQNSLDFRCVVFARWQGSCIPREIMSPATLHFVQGCSRSPQWSLRDVVPNKYRTNLVSRFGINARSRSGISTLYILPPFLVRIVVVVLLLLLLLLLLFVAFAVVVFLPPSLFPVSFRSSSPWYNRTGWLRVKHQLTYLRSSSCPVLFRLPHPPF